MAEREEKEKKEEGEGEDDVSSGRQEALTSIPGDSGIVANEIFFFQIKKIICEIRLF